MLRFLWIHWGHGQGTATTTTNTPSGLSLRLCLAQCSQAEDPIWCEFSPILISSPGLRISWHIPSFTQPAAVWGAVIQKMVGLVRKHELFGLKGGFISSSLETWLELSPEMGLPQFPQLQCL